MPESFLSNPESFLSGIASFLSDSDALRAGRTLQMLARHEIGNWVLTGGLAVELHCLQRGLKARSRPLNDIDFVVDGFERIPETLGADLIFRHVHPNDPQNRTLLQTVYPETAVRVDVFRAWAEVIGRAAPIELACGRFRLISIEDLTARAARLSMDLAQGLPMPGKHARDFLRLLPLVETDAMEPVWQEHRKPSHPLTFAETAELLEVLICERGDLQIEMVYSRDTQAVCSRCAETGAFRLADALRVLSLLGYC